jgi:hypothetical protein
LRALASLATLFAMPAPHPLASLHAGGPDGAALAVAKLRAHLSAHGWVVRTAAAALLPPIHETTLHDWIAAWGLRGEVTKGRADA